MEPRRRSPAGDAPPTKSAVAARTRSRRSRVRRPSSTASSNGIGAALGGVGDEVPLQRDLALVAGDGPRRGRAPRRRRSSGRRRGRAAPGCRARPSARTSSSAPGRDLREDAGSASKRRVAVERVVEQRRRDAPDLADGLVAAGAARSGGASPTRSNRSRVREQDLAAPGRAVGPVARAVEGDADDRALEPVLGHGARHVRVVVLDGDLDRLRAFQRVARRQVVGMQVVRDDLGPDAEEALGALDRLLEGVGRSRGCRGRRCAGRGTRCRRRRCRRCSSGGRRRRARGARRRAARGTPRGT